jgi:hypothetical protein
MSTAKTDLIPKTNRELAKALIVRAEDTSAGGGHTSIPSALGKTWAYEFKSTNRPKKAVAKNVEKK